MLALLESGKCLLLWFHSLRLLVVFTLPTDSWIPVLFEWIEQHYIPLLDDLDTLLTVGWIPCWLKDLAELAIEEAKKQKRGES